LAIMLLAAVLARLRRDRGSLGLIKKRIIASERRGPCNGAVRSTGGAFSSLL